MRTRLAAQLAQRGALTRGYTTHAAGAIPRPAEGARLDLVLSQTDHQSHADTRQLITSTLLQRPCAFGPPQVMIFFQIVACSVDARIVQTDHVRLFIGPYPTKPIMIGS
jgi:hypothetical protein